MSRETDTQNASVGPTIHTLQLFLLAESGTSDYTILRSQVNAATRLCNCRTQASTSCTLVTRMCEDSGPPGKRPSVLAAVLPLAHGHADKTLGEKTESVSDHAYTCRLSELTLLLQLRDRPHCAANQYSQPSKTYFENQPVYSIV